MSWQRLQLFFAVTVTLLLLLGFGCSRKGGGGGVAPPDTSGNGTDTTTTPSDSARILIPAGDFIRGYDDELNYPDEYPVREIYVDSFYISRTEVTNRQFCEFLNDGNDTHFEGRMFITRDGNDFYVPLEGMENHPVVWVDFAAAEAYAEWAGGRLPTEAEWEKAARGTDGRIYPWGNEFIEMHADIGRGREESTQPVGRFENGASPYGLLDMAGSVWEWCSDWYYDYYYNVAPYENPTGPDEPVNYTVKVVRGGSYRSLALEIRCSNREWAPPEFNINGDYRDLGFRVVWDVESEE